MLVVWVHYWIKCKNIQQFLFSAMKPFTGQNPVFDNINSKAKILENVTIHIHKHGYGLSLGRDGRD